MTAARILIYVQHLLGIGHLRRAVILARAAAQHGLDTTLVSGGFPIAGLDLGRAQLVQLPPVRAADVTFKTLLDERDRPITEAWRAQRRRLLQGAFSAVDPDAVVLEMFPFGRRQMRFELEPLVMAIELVQPRPLVISSVRDVLVDKKNTKRTESILEVIERDFDAVLVHGDPAVIPFDASFPAADRIGDKLVYTGYVATASLPPTAPTGREVVVSAGGGAVGTRLIEAALEARKLGVLADRPWRIVTGPNLEQSTFDFFRSWTPGGVTIERWRNDLPRLIAGAALTISQAGYNTMMEILAARVPAVVVPFAEAGETEQTLRAQRLAARGLVTLAPAKGLNGAVMAAAVAEAMARPRPSAAIDMNGAVQSARLIADMIERRRERGAA
ncbi:MAG: glycosyl transferase [Alphaproteobacteria bacterium]|nr:glycosyl transferase [Alphaproteobacteria bacterium]